MPVQRRRLERSPGRVGLPGPGSRQWSWQPCYMQFMRMDGLHESHDLAVVDELQRDLEVGLLEHRDDFLQVVALFAGDADLVALDLGFDRLGALVADQLGDLLGVFAADALFQSASDLVGLAGRLRLPPPPDLWGGVAPRPRF